MRNAKIKFSFAVMTIFVLIACNEKSPQTPPPSTGTGSGYNNGFNPNNGNATGSGYNNGYNPNNNGVNQGGSGAIEITLNGDSSTTVIPTNQVGQQTTLTISARATSSSGGQILVHVDPSTLPQSMQLQGNDQQSVTLLWNPSGADTGSVSVIARDIGLCNSQQGNNGSCNNFQTSTSFDSRKTYTIGANGIGTTNTGPFGGNSGILGTLLPILGSGIFGGGLGGSPIGGFGGFGNNCQLYNQNQIQCSNTYGCTWTGYACQTGTNPGVGTTGQVNCLQFNSNPTLCQQYQAQGLCYYNAQTYQCTQGSGFGGGVGSYTCSSWRTQLDCQNRGCRWNTASYTCY